MPETSQVIISPLAETDYAAWEPMWRKYIGSYDAELPQEVTQKTWSRLTDPDEPVYGAVAKIDGKAVGFSHWLLHLSTWTTQNYAYLEDLFVESGHRGAGIGRKLIEYASDEARKADCERLYWVTNETNVEAQKLYDKIGLKLPRLTYKRDLST